MSEFIPEPKRSRRSVPKVARRLLLFGLILYGLPLLGLFVCQRFLVFNAAASRTRSAALGTQISEGAHRQHLVTNTGDEVMAYYGRALHADGTPDSNYARRPTLLFFYGKGSSLVGGSALFQSFRRLDANVLMPDYVGFGQSSGQESEANCYATASAAYRWLRDQPDTDQQRLVIGGFSLGSGVAVDLAAREIQAHEPVAGLVLFAAYTSMAAEGHQEYPIYPTPLLRLLLKYQFASDTKMSTITCPTLLVQSKADRLIPASMSNTLASLCGGPVTRLVLTRADHAQYFTVDRKAVYPALGHFLETTNRHETQISAQ